MRTKYKAWAKPYIDAHKEVMMSIEQISTFDKPFYLEIGSGKGKFLIDMASAYPDIFFIGIEMNVTCAGITAKKIVESKLDNVKLMFGNAKDILPHIQEKSVEGIFLSFSDPWPKSRHHKRRLTSDNFLPLYAHILKWDHNIYFKTDNKELFEYSKENFPLYDFEIVNVDSNYNCDFNFDAPTEYELSFLEEGKPIYRIVASLRHTFDNYGLFSHYKDGSYLLVKFSNNKEKHILETQDIKIGLDCQNQVIYYQILNIDKLVKIKCNSPALYLPCKEIVILINKVIASVDYPILKIHPNSGFFIGRVNKILSNMIEVDIKDRLINCYKEDDVKINQIVVVALKGTWINEFKAIKAIKRQDKIIEGYILKNGDLEIDNDDTNIFTLDESNIDKVGEDFFTVEEKLC